MDILSLLPEIKYDKRFMVVITDPYSKLTWAIPIKRRTSLLFFACIIKKWVFFHVIPQSMLTDNDNKFISNLPRCVYAIAFITLITIIVHCTRSNIQT